jgi:hypothetical protein
MGCPALNIIVIKHDVALVTKSTGEIDIFSDGALH